MQLWSELETVEAVGAWKSLSALSGQLVEALLRQKLLMTGHYDFRALSGQTLGSLIEMGRAVGILPGFDDPPTGTASVSTARLLRNWASHASLWHDYPTELRATQSLVLAMCTIEGLFSRSRPTFLKAPEKSTAAWWFDHLGNIAPGTLLSFLKSPEAEALVKALQAAPQQLYVHVIRYGTAGSVATLLELAHDYQFDQDALRHCLVQHFLDLVRNASRSAFRAFLDLLWRLRIVGLEAHAISFAILLPFDVHLFQRLLETRSPAWVARYVTECFRAEPDVFAATAGDLARMGGVIDAFWVRFGNYSGNILNFANILGHLPYELRILILERTDVNRLAQWVADSEPRNSVNLLASINDRIIRQAPHINSLRQAVVRELRSRVKGTPAEGLHEIPLRLTRFKLNNDSAGVEVVTEILDVATAAAGSAADWTSVERILWDSYAFFPSLEAKAAAGSVGVLVDYGTELPLWTRLCLAALADLAGQPYPRFLRDELDHTALLKNATNPAINRWELFLGSLTYWRECKIHNLRFPPEVIAVLRQLQSETERTREGPSARLLDEIARLLNESKSPT